MGREVLAACALLPIRAASPFHELRLQETQFAHCRHTLQGVLPPLLPLHYGRRWTSLYKGSPLQQQNLITGLHSGLAHCHSCWGNFIVTRIVGLIFVRKGSNSDAPRWLQRPLIEFLTLIWIKLVFTVPKMRQKIPVLHGPTHLFRHEC